MPIRQAYLEIIRQPPSRDVLRLASERGYEKIVNAILNIPIFQDQQVYNVVLGEASRGGHGDLVDRMLKLGATDYDEAMAMAARGGHSDLVDQMLELGGDQL
jgi:hypothetical protein